MQRTIVEFQCELNCETLGEIAESQANASEKAKLHRRHVEKRLHARRLKGRRATYLGTGTDTVMEQSCGVRRGVTLAMPASII